MFTTTLEELSILHCLSSFHLPLRGLSACIGSGSAGAGQNASTSWVLEGSGGVWKVKAIASIAYKAPPSFQVEEKGRIQGRSSTGSGQAST